MNHLKALQAAIILAAMASPAMAQQPAPTPGTTMPMKPGAAMMPMAGMPMASGSDASPSTKAFKAADDKMMRDMDRPMTGHADQDFGP